MYLFPRDSQARGVFPHLQPQLQAHVCCLGSRSCTAGCQVVMNQYPQQTLPTGGDRSWLRDHHAQVYKKLKRM